MKKEKLKGISVSDLFEYKPPLIDFFMLKIKWLLFVMDIKYYIKKVFYCDRGWHKLSSGSIETTNNKGEKIVTHFVKCINCNTHFFPTKKDKDNFNRIKDQEKALFKKMADCMLKKHLKKK